MRSLGGQVVPARTALAVLAVVGALAAVAVEPASGGPASPTTTAEQPPATTVPGTTAPATSAPPTTTPPPTTDPDTAEAPAPAGPGAPEGAVQPDVAVRRAPRGAWIGEGRVGGAAPTVEVPAQPGQRVTYVFRIHHGGGDAARVSLRSAGNHPRASVQWRLGRRDVTGAVARGAMRIRIAPGGHRDVILVMTLRRTAPRGFSVPRTLVTRALSGNGVDRARAIVTRPPVPVRLHDVGPALGLPRHTKSFDFDTGDLDGDGTDDLVMSVHGRVHFYLNHRPGLEPIFDTYAKDLHGCAIGDVNTDDRLDVYCNRGAGHGSLVKSNFLWVQQPGLQFEDQAGAYGLEDPFGRGRQAVFADLDHQDGLDLFVGNENPRSDGNLSVNRVYLDQGGVGFAEADWLARDDTGAVCAQAFDQDRNGWQDLLVCGGASPATVGWNPAVSRLHLFRNLRRPGGGRRLVDVAPRLGIDFTNVQSARLAHLDGDRLPDLVVVTHRSLTIWPGLANGRFGLPVLHDRLNVGHWVTVANVDGRGGPDLFVVQGCNGSKTINYQDRLYVDTGPGWGWRRGRVPGNVAGCGDVSEALDVDGDGVDDLLVGNGRWSSRGPIQVLTSGRYWG